MNLLLDTHILLWWLSDDRRLGKAARDLITDQGNAISVSVVSLWEIVVKQRIGKLDADIAEIVGAIEQDGFALLAIAPRHLTTLARLPAFHDDPFDHLLIAQAIAEDMTFLSSDRHTPQYPVRLAV